MTVTRHGIWVLTARGRRRGDARPPGRAVRAAGGLSGAVRAGPVAWADVVDYPHTRRDDTREQLHGRTVEDPHRWLEDPDSPETGDWVRRQNELSSGLPGGPARARWFGATMAAVLARPRAGTPQHRGGRYLVNRNDGRQNQDVWYVADSLAELLEGGRVLLDPNTFSADGTSSLAASACAATARRWPTASARAAATGTPSTCSTSTRAPRSTDVGDPDEVLRSRLAAGRPLLRLHRLRPRGPRAGHRDLRAGRRQAAGAPGGEPGGAGRARCWSSPRTTR